MIQVMVQLLKSYESLGAKIDISIYVHIYISKCVDLNIA